MFNKIKLPLLILSVFITGFASVFAEKCSEQVEIDSVFYDVGEQWCGHEFDSTQIANPEKLVRIPKEFSYKDYKIYVESDCRDAFIKMARAAQKDSVTLLVKSGYRSKSYQKVLIRRRQAKGEKMTDIFKMVAPPGYSEHETGFAFDFADNKGLFYKSKSYKWLLKNGSKFGFYETYPENADNGVLWEPWHWAYKPK